MTAMTPSPADLCRALLDRYGAHPPWETAGGYISLLVDYTHEDKAAKGLRKIADPAAARPPIHFSALEIVADQDLVLLLGAPGAGKTCFALHLALALAGEQLGDARWTLAALHRDLPRNDLGDRSDEAWKGALPTPLYVPAPGPVASLEALLPTDLLAILRSPQPGPVLLIIDAAEALGADGPVLLEALARLAADRLDMKVLVLGRSDACSAWIAPTAFVRYSLLPLLQSQRRDAMRAASGAEPYWPATPDLFALAVSLGSAPEPDWRLVDAWLEREFGADGASKQVQAALGRALHAEPAHEVQLPRSLTPYLLARGLETLADDGLGRVVGAAPEDWAAAVEILIRRRRDRGRPVAGLIRVLLNGPSGTNDRAALTVAQALVGDAPCAEWDLLRPALVGLIARGALTPAERRTAGAHLARIGDPRDLEELVAIAGGRLTMGSASHPNSMPVHRVTVANFRVGRYPVVNRDYARFVEETGRPWRTADGRRPDRANAPATDLTWRDARAYCDWLTPRWRAEGRIGADERARLPTEPEWEYAARGPHPDHGQEAAVDLVYPWRGPWAPDHANSAEAGFNAPCTVGLFPKGRSISGLDDMTGQVWEWTATLWGPDMATPSFRYPYADDGREDADAGPTIRRVLRGGCFSSAREKACCSYRGSLEPDGFWRGNGFRVAVAKA